MNLYIHIYVCLKYISEYFFNVMCIAVSIMPKCMCVIQSGSREKNVFVWSKTRSRSSQMQAHWRNRKEGITCRENYFMASAKLAMLTLARSKARMKGIPTTVYVTMLRRKQQQQQKGHCHKQAEEHPTEMSFVSLCTQKIFGLSGIDQNFAKKGQESVTCTFLPFLH